MMKKLLSVIAGLVFSFGMFAQSGVDFQHLTFDEALAKAKAENKLVFIDCYTTWCGPCKYMSTTIFPKEEAGAFFNPRFVCVKFDMEQGEGKTLKDKLDVKAFPSFYIVRPDGVIQHKLVGSDELEPFVERVKKGLDEKTSLLYLTEMYKKGKMNKKQLLAYKVALEDAYDRENAGKVQQQLASMLTEKDKLKKEFWPIFEDEKCGVGSDDFNFVLAHLPVFEKNQGKEAIDEYLYKAYLRAVSPYIYGREKGKTVALEELKKQLDALNIAKKKDLLDKYAVAEMVKGKDIEKLLSLYEPKAAGLEQDELWTAVSALQAAGQQATKEQYARIQAILEKAIANPTNNKLKDYLGRIVESYKKKAHVGVYFEDLTFEQALEKAAQQKKMVFLDGYTSWCGPCKYMATTIFPMEKMGDFMNPQFICVKYDMEKGEGPELAKKFGIRAFPTFIILNGDGSVRHKLIGGDEADSFIERVKEAFDDNKATGVLDAKYQEGNRDKEFLVKYIKSLNSLYSPDAQKVAGELFQALTEEEKVSENYWFIFENYEISPLHSVTADYLQTNREKFNQAVGKEKVEDCLFTMYQQKVLPVFFGDTTVTVSTLDQLNKEAMALKLQDAKVLTGTVNIAKAKINGELDRLLATCEREIQQMPAEQFPYFYLGYDIQGKASKAQLDRWVRIGKKLVAKAQDKEYAGQLDQYIQSMEKAE